MGFIRQKLGRTKHAKEETQIIGVVGTDRAVGVTHWCILLANYLHSGCGKRTAVLEWNGHGDFARFGDVCTATGKLVECYRIQGVDFYQCSSGRTLSRCIQDGYNKIIIDFGSLQEQGDAELLRCHRVYLLVSLSEWQEGVFGNSDLWREHAASESWQCLASFGSEESRIRWNKRHKPAIGRIPFSADAFTVTKELMEWFRQMMQQEMFS